MSRWFRVYDEALEDPKVQFLSDKAFRGWFNILCVASKCDGHLPDMRELSYRLRLPETKVRELLSELQSAGLVDETEDGLTPHNWNGRQFKSDTSNERVQRYRERHRNVTCNVTGNEIETPPETEQNRTEQNTIREAREAAECSGKSPDWPPDYREQFWRDYPNKVGKPVALNRLERIRRRGDVRWADLMAGLEGYKRSKPIDRQWLNPATFLNQERWADQPAANVLPLRRVPDV